MYFVRLLAGVFRESVLDAAPAAAGDTPMSETERRFVREPEVKRRTTLSRAQRWKMEQKGEFPRRFRLGPHTVAWWDDEIEQWMQSRPRAGYVPRDAVLGPQQNDDEEKPSLAPPLIARPRRDRPRKRKLTAADPTTLNVSP
jgi:prophage regulatory protein